MPIYGRFDGYSESTGTESGARNLFVSLYRWFKNFLEVQGVATIIASQFGASGTGLDGYDGTGVNEPGLGAFFVVQINPTSTRTWEYYLLIQFSWGGGGFDNHAPSNPSRINGGLGSGLDVGIVIAAAFDAGNSPANPWLGTTNNDGSDTKGTPVWGAPGGGSLAILPRSNATGGTFATDKEDQMPISNTSPSSALYNRYNFITDGNNFIFTHNLTDTSASGLVVSLVGLYTPVAGLSVLAPLYAWYSNGNIPDYNQTYPESSGGVVVPLGVEQVQTTWQVSTDSRRNALFSPPRADMWPLQLNASGVGYVGQEKDGFVRLANDFPIDRVNLTGTRMAIGSNANNFTDRLIHYWAPGQNWQANYTDPEGTDVVVP